jgi:hypothetical protein
MFPSLFPRPKLALATDTTCRCPCHAVGGAAAAENEYDEYLVARPPTINGIGNRSVPTADVLACLTACPTCRRHHCAALSGRPERLAMGWARPGSPWNPKPIEAAPDVVPPPLPPLTTQADGDDGN